MTDVLRSAMSFVENRSRADLDTDEMLLFALLHAVEIAGEAASKITAVGRDELDLPWADMIGMRNRLAHVYFDVDLDILWRTVTEAVPPVVDQLGRLLDKKG